MHRIFWSREVLFRSRIPATPFLQVCSFLIFHMAVPHCHQCPEHLPPTKGFSFNYSKGNAYLLDGSIYYSPNCSRPVVIPPPESSSPYNQEKLSPSMFRQPVRWSSSFAWMSFILLAPSFISLLVGPKQFMMKGDDVDSWFPLLSVHQNTCCTLKALCSESFVPPRHSLYSSHLFNYLVPFLQQTKKLMPYI